MTQPSPPSHDGTLPIDRPRVVNDATDLTWDAACDVLVVGLGAAGAAVAITAQERGSQVLIAERFDGGGATSRSGGIVYAGGGTPQQIQAGYHDTPAEMFKYLRQEVGDAVSETTLRQFCDDSRGLLAWLESLGAEYSSNPNPPKTSYPREHIYLYYSGNEGVPAYAAQAKPAPRGHRTKGSGLSGLALFDALLRQVESRQIPIRRQCAVRRLVTDKQGAVLGVEAAQQLAGSAEARKHRSLIQRAERWHNYLPQYADHLRNRARRIEQQHAQPVLLRAYRGVVLTTGGFIFNRDMLQEHAHQYLDNMRLGTTGCDGSGIRLGLSVGAVADRMNKVSAWRFINPPTRLPTGIAVNQHGLRFCNEQVYGAKLGVTLCEENNGKGWLIIDNEQRKAALREALFGKLWFFQSVPALLWLLFSPKRKSLAKLSQRLGVPAQALQETVTRYNHDIESAQVDRMGKAKEMCQALRSPPFTALDLSAKSVSPLPSITLGGLRVDERNSAVLRADGQPILGLYAAGRCAVGVASNGYVSGLSLADCLWSGRRAGRAVTT